MTTASTSTNPATLLIVPGVGDSGPEHWQTLLEAAHPSSRRVRQQDWSYPVRSDWVHALAQTVDETPGPLLLVGHSAGAAAIVHWAASGKRRGSIRGALLVAPADLETEMEDGMPIDFLEDAGWIPCPRSALPFPSVLIASTNDPYARLERSREFAQAWGSRLLIVEGGGHLNADAGFGPWPLIDQVLEEGFPSA